MYLKAKKWMPLVFVAAAACLPLIVKSNYMILLFCFMGLYMISVSGLDLLFGYCGQISLGNAAFYGIGAYSTAIITTRTGCPILLSVLLSVIVATVIGMLLAYPASRLVGHFLALLTICFGQLFYLVVANFSSWSGGFSGINFIPELSLFGYELKTNQQYFYVVLISVVIFLLAKQRIVHSRHGRALIAIRENEHAAEGNGIPVVRYKVFAFAATAVFTSFTGCMYAHLVGFISPETFKQNQSLIYLTMLLLGGMGNFAGPLIGAVLITIINEYLQVFGSYQMLIYGAIIIIIILFMPEGIVGIYDTIKSKWKKRGRRGHA